MIPKGPLFRYHDPMRKIAFLLFALLSSSTWAGTQVKAHLENNSDPQAWVDVTASIAVGHLKMDLQGPKCHGSLLYDQATSLLFVVDDLHKTVLPITSTDQNTLKFIGAMASDKVEAALANGKPEDQKFYQLAKKDAKALFNGTPVLRGKGVGKGAFTCDLYRTEQYRSKAREVWMVRPEKAGMDPGDYDTFLGLANLALDLCGGELFQLGADPDVFRRRFTSTRLPVAAILYEDGKPSSQFQVLSVHAWPPHPGVFDPPAEYQKLSLMSLIGQGTTQPR